MIYATTWQGLDDVVEKVAADAGHPAREPYINPEGDLLLFMFLLAGVIGGFIIGDTFRGLFPPRNKTSIEAAKEQNKV